MRLWVFRSPAALLQGPHYGEAAGPAAASSSPEAPAAHTHKEGMWAPGQESKCAPLPQTPPLPPPPVERREGGPKPIYGSQRGQGEGLQLRGWASLFGGKEARRWRVSGATPHIKGFAVTKQPPLPG